MITADNEADILFPYSNTEQVAIYNLNSEKEMLPSLPQV